MELWLKQTTTSWLKKGFVFLQGFEDLPDAAVQFLMNDSSQLLVYPADAKILLGPRSRGAVGFHRFKRGREETEAALPGLD